MKRFPVLLVSSPRPPAAPAMRAARVFTIPACTRNAYLPVLKGGPATQIRLSVMPRGSVRRRPDTAKQIVYATPSSTLAQQLENDVSPLLSCLPEHKCSPLVATLPSESSPACFCWVAVKELYIPGPSLYP